VHKGGEQRIECSGEQTLKDATAVTFGFQMFHKTASFSTLNNITGRQEMYEKLFTTDTYSSQTVLSSSCCSFKSQAKHKITLYFNTKPMIPRF